MRLISYGLILEAERIIELLEWLNKMLGLDFPTNGFNLFWRQADIGNTAPSINVFCCLLFSQIKARHVYKNDNGMYSFLRPWAIQSWLRDCLNQIFCEYAPWVLNIVVILHFNKCLWSVVYDRHDTHIYTKNEHFRRQVRNCSALALTFHWALTRVSWEWTQKGLILKSPITIGTPTYWNCYR